MVMHTFNHYTGEAETETDLLDFEAAGSTGHVLSLPEPYFQIVFIYGYIRERGVYAQACGVRGQSWVWFLRSHPPRDLRLANYFHLPGTGITDVHHQAGFLHRGEELTQGTLLLQQALS